MAVTASTESLFHHYLEAGIATYKPEQHRIWASLIDTTPAFYRVRFYVARGGSIAHTKRWKRHRRAMRGQPQ